MVSLQSSLNLTMQLFGTFTHFKEQWDVKIDRNNCALVSHFLFDLGMKALEVAL